MNLNLNLKKLYLLNLEPTPGFGKYRRFLECALSHPAKANTNLLEFLVLKYTKEGETVLDPMAGSGSTCVVAALHNRNAIGVELEEKFFNWMEEAKENVEKHPSLLPKGKIINILGDARKLSELLKNKIDSIVTSPPYAEANRGGGIAKKGYEGKYGKDEKLHLRHDRPLSDNPNNISNLPLGKVSEISTIITSPPYVNVNNVKKNSEEFWKKAKEGGKRWGSKPPSGTREKQLTSDENIANLPHGNIDTIITSPPYEHQLHDSREKREKGCWKGSEIDVKKNVPMGYSENSENIGNLMSSDKEYEALAKGLMVKGKPTYLSEMLKVYKQMWEVLKPNGLAIIIIKAFVRNKRIIDLPYHTYLLLKACGFVLEKLYKLRLKNQSFWRTLYYKKFPDVPLINHEYILVMRKV
jgi:DNA modification methylase